jgi:hypothetical protein
MRKGDEKQRGTAICGFGRRGLGRKCARQCIDRDVSRLEQGDMEFRNVMKSMSNTLLRSEEIWCLPERKEAHEP